MEDTAEPVETDKCTAKEEDQGARGREHQREEAIGVHQKDGRNQIEAKVVAQQLCNGE